MLLAFDLHIIVLRLNYLIQACDLLVLLNLYPLDFFIHKVVHVCLLFVQPSILVHLLLQLLHLLSLLACQLLMSLDILRLELLL